MTHVRFVPTLLVAATVLALPSFRAAADEAGALNPMKAIDRTALDGFVERPLFDPARRLPPPPPTIVTMAPPPPPPVESPPALQLLGIIHGDRDMAIVHRDGGEKTVILRTGDRVGSWVVTVMPPLAVSLRSGNRTVNFSIFAKVGQIGLRAGPASTSGIGAFLHRHRPDD